MGYAGRLSVPVDRIQIVEGMLAKRFYAATPGGALSDQAWIHDASKSVGQALSEAGAEPMAQEFTPFMLTPLVIAMPHSLDLCAASATRDGA
jgi:hypothetical protein